jgi:hypothetical protein
MTRISPDNLIPPDSDIAQMLLQWSEDSDTRVWNIANLTNDLIAELEGGIATRADIYRAVATRCKGQRPNTIRRWAEVAEDFPPKLQKKYSQLLSFQHFKVSRKLFKDGYTPSIDYALDWCVTGNDDKLSAGRFHTVADMLTQFLPQEKDKSPLKRYWDKVKDTMYDQFLMVDNDFYRTKLLEDWISINYVVQEVDRVSKEDLTNA